MFFCFVSSICIRRSQRKIDWFFNTSSVAHLQTNTARIFQDSSKYAKILLVDINLARILQETCQVHALTCKILQECLPGSWKICIFPQPGVTIVVTIRGARKRKQGGYRYGCLRSDDWKDKQNETQIITYIVFSC